MPCKCTKCELNTTLYKLENMCNENQKNGLYDDFDKIITEARKETPEPFSFDVDLTNPKDAIGSKKVNLSLVPPVANILEAKVMELGATKYGAFNWRNSSVRQTVYQDATLRHLYAIMDGEDIDPESGISHWAHIRANTGIVLDAKESGKLIDDRKSPGKASEVLKRLNNAEVSNSSNEYFSSYVVEESTADLKLPKNRKDIEGK